MMPGGERYRPSWKGLQPGDPWTFITDKPITMGMNGGHAATVGSVVQWTPDDGPALLFHIGEVISVDFARNRVALICTHIAQPPAFREEARGQ